MKISETRPPADDGVSYDAAAAFPYGLYGLSFIDPPGGRVFDLAVQRGIVTAELLTQPLKIDTVAAVLQLTRDLCLLRLRSTPPHWLYSLMQVVLDLSSLSVSLSELPPGPG
ncbi:hypothetical protein J2853_004197 [Streptosporangium lutulentum]|uniref:Uncharacterized protein n=1 Tax=Streptosporangium lutulentum TaxID=1461250 RepID=A0ABT9QF74_9ACTN|nr:hypothetical protein [Streptosporangium lutulentum]